MPDTTANDHEWPEWEQGSDDDAEAETWDDPGDPPGESTDPPAARFSAAPEPADPLATLRDAERVQVWRTKPTWCRGLLCTIDLAADEEIDLGQLKDDWGGGVIQLRPMQHTSQGWKFKRGAVSVQFTGPPRERGMPLGRDGEPRAVEVNPRPVVPEARALARQTMGADPLGVMAQLFERITDRLDGIERRISLAPEAAPPPDPLAEVKRAGLMVRELRELAGVFAGTEPLPADEPDDDEEDDEGDEEEPQGPEAMLMRLLEKKLTEDEEKPSATPAPTSGPRLIKAEASSRPTPPPTPTARREQVIDVEPEPEPEPEAAPVENLGTVIDPAPDPWSEQVAPELRGQGSAAPATVPAAALPIVEQLRAMPTEQAMELLDSVVRSLPKEQVISWIQAMQQAK